MKDNKDIAITHREIFRFRYLIEPKSVQHIRLLIRISFFLELCFMQWQYLLTPFVIHPRSINLFCFPIRHDLRTLQNMFLFFVKTCRVFSLLIAAVTAHLYINLRIWFVTLLFMYSIINIYAYSLNTITSSPNVDQRQTKLLNCDVPLASKARS